MKKLLIFSTYLTFILALHETAFSFQPKGAHWKPIPELSDEFNGDELDPSKWFDHNPWWRGRKRAYFSQKNVVVKDGKLHLTTRAEDLANVPEGYNTFTTAAVKSKAGAKYGYFEIKCKMMDSRASSAFWFNNRKPDEYTEIDVFETGPRMPGNENNVWFTLHNNAFYIYEPLRLNYRKKEYGMYFNTIYKAPYDITSEYHVYGVEWDPDSIKLYVDDQLQWGAPNTGWNQTLFINFDSEIFPNWFGVPDKSELPATFSIEYIRSWRKTTAPEIERNNKGMVTIFWPDKNSVIYYTTDGSTPTDQSSEYTKPFLYKEKGLMRAVAYQKEEKSNIEEVLFGELSSTSKMSSPEWNNLEKVMKLWEKEKAKYHSYDLTFCHEQYGVSEALVHNISNDTIKSRKYYKWAPDKIEIVNEPNGNLGTLNLGFPLKIMEDYFKDAQEELEKEPNKPPSKIGLYFMNGEKDEYFFQIPGHNTPDTHNYIVIELKDPKEN